MSKLYPPILENYIPAILYNKNDTAKKPMFQIPFSIGQTTTLNESIGCAIIIQNIQGQQIGSSKTGFQQNNKAYFVYNTIEWIDENYFEPNSYYRVLLAFIDNNNEKEVGYYSQPAIMKVTNGGIIGLNNLLFSTDNIYSVKKEIIGFYHPIDVSEKEYSYCFSIFNENNVLKETSGILFHNNLNDGGLTSSGTSYDKYIPKMELEFNKNYFLKYSITTVNKLILEDTFIITGQYLAAPPEEYDGKIYLYNEIDNENGCINIYLKKISDIESIIINGNFELVRSSKKDNFSQKITVSSFDFQDYLLKDKILLYQDKTVEHGIKYKYFIMQYNRHGIYTEPISKDDKEYCTLFEDIFLFDGKRQLKVRFNPKINSYKTNILQTKTDTIGSKYPYFFRNGNVSYKDFPISGLISYQMDENELFASKEEIGLNSSEESRSKTKSNEKYYYYQKQNLIDDNIYSERIFKQQVLDFLNNGKLKLFRSATEGNHIVNIMNVSLTPEDRLGRMLHSFSCTAIEADDANNIDKLFEHNFLKHNKEYYYNVLKKYINIKNSKSYLYTIINEGTDKEEIIETSLNSIVGSHELVTKFNIKNALPGSQVYVETVSGNQQNYTIGATGRLNIIIDNDDYISTILPLFNYSNEVQLQIEYLREKTETDFDSIIGIKNKTVYNYEINYNLFKKIGNGNSIKLIDLIEYISDIKADNIEKVKIYSYGYKYNTNYLEGTNFYNLGLNDIWYSITDKSIFQLFSGEKLYYSKNNFEDSNNIQNFTINFQKNINRYQYDIVFVISFSVEEIVREHGGVK